MKSYCPIKQGGFFKISSQYLNSIPISLDSSEHRNKINFWVDQIHTLMNDNLKTSSKEIEAEIDQPVYALYGLMEEEIAIVESSIILLTAAK